MHRRYEVEVGSEPSLGAGTGVRTVVQRGDDRDVWLQDGRWIRDAAGAVVSGIIFGVSATRSSVLTSRLLCPAVDRGLDLLPLVFRGGQV